MALQRSAKQPVLLHHGPGALDCTAKPTAVDRPVKARYDVVPIGGCRKANAQCPRINDTVAHVIQVAQHRPR